MQIVSAILEDTDQAASAIDELVAAGFPPEEISVLMRGEDGVQGVSVEHRTGIAPGLATGGMVGGAVGAVGAGLVATGALAPVGVGFVAAGPVVAALEGAVAGGAAGGVLGILAGLGFWKTEADLPSDDLKGGHVLLAVPTPDSHLRTVREILGRCAGGRIHPGA